MRIAATTLSTPKWKPIRDIATPNLAAYCARHGYPMIEETDAIDPKRPAAWSKILLLEKHLPDYDWLWWKDADALVMNSQVRLETFLDPDFDMVISIDANGLNTGSFFVRNTPATFRGLRAVYNNTVFINYPWWEQAAMNNLIARGQFPMKYKNVPQSDFNSYIETYQPGDFLLHFVGGTIATKLEQMQQYEKDAT